MRRTWARCERSLQTPVTWSLVNGSSGTEHWLSHRGELPEHLTVQLIPVSSLPSFHVYLQVFSDRAELQSELRWTVQNIHPLGQDSPKSVYLLQATIFCVVCCSSARSAQQVRTFSRQRSFCSPLQLCVITSRMKNHSSKVSKLDQLDPACRLMQV